MRSSKIAPQYYYADVLATVGPLWTAGLFAVRKMNVSNSQSEVRSLVSRSVASDSRVNLEGRTEVCE